jgi:glycosyltransferase involved in cell wall biosynthesis
MSKLISVNVSPDSMDFAEVPASVLMFVPQYPYPIVGGLEKQAHELSKALIKQGLCIQIISGKIFRDQPDEENVEGINVVRIPWFRYKLFRFLFWPWYIAYAFWIRRSRFDVIHIHQHSWVGLYVILLARLLRKPILAKLPNVGDFGIPGMRSRVFGRLRQRILLSSNAIVAMSTESKRELLELGYSPGRILATPNGIDLQDAGPDCAIDREQDVCRVVFVGRLIEQKRLDVLLDAWALVIKGGAGMLPILEIWGKGPLEAALKARVATLGLDESVRFVGHVKNVRCKLRSVDIFVLTSSNEGNSNAVLEAMAAGLPVITTPVGGSSMLLGPEAQDFLCPVGDPKLTAKMLQTLIYDEDLRVSLGMVMRRRIEQYFDINCVAQAYVGAYKQLAAGKWEQVSRCSNPVVECGI